MAEFFLQCVQCYITKDWNKLIYIHDAAFGCSDFIFV